MAFMQMLMVSHSAWGRGVPVEVHRGGRERAGVRAEESVADCRDVVSRLGLRCVALDISYINIDIITSTPPQDVPFVGKNRRGNPLVLSILPFVTTVQLGSVMMDDRRPIVRPLALVQSSNAAGFLEGTYPDRLSARTPHAAGGRRNPMACGMCSS